jgi:MFS family permease
MNTDVIIKNLSDKPFIILKDFFHHVKIFSKNARLFLLGSFFISLGFAVFQLLLNLYFKELNFTEGFMGKVLSIQSFGAVLVSIPAAILIQKISIKKAILWSVFFTGIGYFFQVTSISSFLILAFSFIAGMMAVVIRVAAAPFFMLNSTPKERTYLFSSNFAVWILAGIIGSLGGGYLTTFFMLFTASKVLAFRFSLITALIISLWGLIPFSYLKPEKKEEKSGAEKFSFNSHFISQRGKLIFKLCFPFFVLGLGAGLIIPFMNLYFRERFLQPAKNIGLFYATLQFFMLAGIITGPILSKKFGMIKTIVYTQLLSLPFMLLLAFTYNLKLAVGAFFVRGALMNMSQPISTNFSMEKVKRSEQPLTNSLTSLSWTLAWALSAVWGGKLIQHYGFTPPLLIASFLYILSSLFYFYFFSGAEDLKMGKTSLVFPGDIKDE